MSRDFVGALLQLNAEKQISREQLIGAVEDGMATAKQLPRVLVSQGLLVCDDGDVGIQGFETGLRAEALRLSEVGGVVEHLPVEVADLHALRVDHRERSHAGGSQIHRRRRTEASSPDDGDLRARQLSLAGDTDFRKDELAAIPFDLRVSKLHDLEVRVTCNA